MPTVQSNFRLIIVFLLFGGIFFALTHNPRNYTSMHEVYSHLLTQEYYKNTSEDGVQIIESYNKIRDRALSGASQAEAFSDSVAWIKLLAGSLQTSMPKEISSAYGLYEILEQQPSVLSLTDNKKASMAEIVWKIIAKLRFEEMHYANDDDRAIPLLLSTKYEILTTSMMLQNMEYSALLCNAENQRFLSVLNAEIMQDAKLLDGYTPSQVVQDKLYEYKAMRQKNNQQIQNQCNK